MLLGIDFGTSSVKLGLFDRQGLLLGTSTGFLDTSQPAPGQHELNPEKAWSLFVDCLQKISGDENLSAVEAVGVTGTSQINFWGEDKQAVRPGILYGDERLPSREKTERILEKVSAADIGAVFGLNRPSENQIEIILRSLPISKWIWLWETDRQVFQETKWITTTSHGFLASRLTGTLVGDLFDEEINQQIGQIFDLSIPTETFPDPPGIIIGRITTAASKETGLPKDTPVILGGIDSQMSLLGGGVTRAGQMLNQSGTTDVFALALENQPRSNTGYHFPYFIDGLWILSLAPLRGGVIQWGMKILQPESDNRDVLSFHALAAASPPGARGLLCLPYFQGEKGIVHDPEARGLLVGMNPQHNRGDLARAILEGIAFSFREVIEKFESEGFPVKEIRVSGGGAQHPLFNQIKADVLQRPIIAMDIAQTGCLGAAMSAAAAIGYYPDLHSAASVMSRVGEKFSPDSDQADLYTELFHAFQNIYLGNKTIFSSLAAWRQKFITAHSSSNINQDSQRR